MAAFCYSISFSLSDYGKIMKKERHDKQEQQKKKKKIHHILYILKIT